ncbi:MAG: ABC transporter ATP-binding protein [Promethearchaeota archaeon]|jgi:oligopeptide/dipeptide ABC transporter ATP-binding protein
MFFIINFSFQEDSVKKTYKISSLITSAIIFGIILGIRSIFETLGMIIQIFNVLNNDILYFGIMVILFLFLHKPFLRKFGLKREDSDETKPLDHRFKKILKYLILITGVVAVISLSITIFKIPLYDPIYADYSDIFSLGIFWGVAVIFILIFLTSVINRFLSIETRIEKGVLKGAMYGGGFVAFGVWFLQSVIFEVYLNKMFGFEIIIQDIRVLFVVISGIYITVFFNLLKAKLLPDASEKGSEKVKELVESELMKVERNNNSMDTELSLKDQDTVKDAGDGKFHRFPQGISLKMYFYLFKKLNKSQELDDNSISESKFGKSSNKIIAGLLLGIPVIITLIVRILFNQNPISKIVFLSCMCAFFMVVGDFGINFLFNRINPANKRVSNLLLMQSFLFGGMATFWMWIGPFFVIYLYLFIFITETVLLNLTFIAILSIAMFVLGTKIIWWYATSIKMWDASMKNAPYVKKKASRVNLAWLIVNIPLRVFTFFIIKQSGIYYTSLFSQFWADDTWPTQYDLLIPLMLTELIIIAINIVIGIVLIKLVYKRTISESFKFLIFSLIIMYLVTIVISIFLGLFQSLMLSYQYTLPDPRIPLIVATGIYIISIGASLRIDLTPDSSEGEDKLRAALQPYEETNVQGSFAKGDQPILSVEDLTTYFYTEEGVVRAVEGVSFNIFEGETLGLVGETGCGKSVTALSILRLVRPPGEIKSGRVFYEGEDLHQKSEEEFLKYRGNRITMIFQDPLNSLNPVYKIGDQISEVYQLHMGDELLIEAVKKNTSIYKIARKWSQKVLKDLNIPTPRIIFDRYPHELSGGMRQRVQIAMGLACSPKLLIADEPTTALDVTIQNQILKLMKDLKTKYNTSILFITHDLGIISKMCDRVAVMYSGLIVEYGDIEKLFITPYHPYTRGLISSVPVVGKKKETLEVIPGTVPNLIYPPSGCRFHPRCQYCFEPCDSEIPKNIETEPNYFVACHLYNPEYKDLAEISIKNTESKIIDEEVTIE